MVESSLLKRDFPLVISNDLEVSRASTISAVELLRRHQPDASKWLHFVGVDIY